jgi:hypothetical protein
VRISLRTFGESHHANTSASARSRGGFVIVEIIVAMVLLAIAVTSLAGLLYSISQSGMVATGNAYRNGALMNAVNRFEGVPYSTITVGTQNDSVMTAPYPHRRKVVVTEPAANVVKAITVIITPTNPRYKPDTVSFIRTNAATSRVLCKTCLTRP